MRRIILATLIGLASPALAGTGQLVVPTFQTSGVDPNTAPVMTELVLEGLLTRHGLHALGPRDVQDLLVTEETRQTMGCETSCMRELAGALGASKLVAGTLGRLGEAYVVTLKLVDVESAQVLSRASRNFEKLEGARDAIGPLIDELLGDKPRASFEPPKLASARKEAEKQRPVSPVGTFCGATLDAYQSALLAPEEPGRLVQRRRGLLEDLLLTPFLAEVEKKVACIEARRATVAPRLADLRLSATSPDAFTRAQKATAEWAELDANLALLLEAYRRGLDKEQRGTGARPVELPFAVGAPKLVAEGDDRGRSAHEAACEVLARALEAVGRSDKPAFLALFTEPGPRGRSSARDLYVTALGLSERFELDPCPWFVLDPADRAAREAARAKSGRTRVCLRKRAPDGHVTLDDVTVSGGKLDDWRP